MPDDVIGIVHTKMNGVSMLPNSGEEHWGGCYTVQRPQFNEMPLPNAR